tara:strand:+ start:714 stop:875 length:162 start_codon:yes stop_codon:yes gene_type:complete
MKSNLIAPFPFPEDEFNIDKMFYGTTKKRELCEQLSRKGISVRKIFKLKKYLK